MEEKIKSIASFAINHFGEEKQLLKVQEELIELSLALIHHKRYNNEKSYNAVIDEVADVAIMLEQLKVIFPIDKINDRIEFKISRLKKRIESLNNLNEL